MGHCNLLSGLNNKPLLLHVSPLSHLGLSSDLGGSVDQDWTWLTSAGLTYLSVVKYMLVGAGWSRMASLTGLGLGALSAGIMEMTGAKCFSSSSKFIYVAMSGYRGNRNMTSLLRPGYGIGQLSLSEHFIWQHKCQGGKIIVIYILMKGATKSHSESVEPKRVKICNHLAVSLSQTMYFN